MAEAAAVERMRRLAELDHVPRQRLGAGRALGPVLADEGLDAELVAAVLRISSCSASVSVSKRLIATTDGTPNLRTLRTWRSRLASPLFSAVRFSLPSSSFGTPPCILSARTVATITAAAGRQAGLAALDVEELLGAEVGAEARPR